MSAVELTLNVMAAEVVTQAEETQNMSGVELTCTCTLNIMVTEVVTQAKEETQNKYVVDLTLNGLAAEC